MKRTKTNLKGFFKDVLDMKYFSGGYQNSPHESQIKNLLISRGFNEISKGEEPKSGQFVYQPHGNNKSPDFTVNDRGKIYNLECKTSKGAKPVYNGGLPNPDYIYIFCIPAYFFGIFFVI